MPSSQPNTRIIDKIRKIKEKYSLDGQDLTSHFEGMLYQTDLTYQDYFQVDTLLNLQNPRSVLPEENIYILCHQIKELYYKLILNEIDSLAGLKKNDHNLFIQKIKRLNKYFKHLSKTFSVFSKGVEEEKFINFRLGFLPVSKFDSTQFRLIEIASTDMYNLISEEMKETLDVEDKFYDLYHKNHWKMVVSNKLNEYKLNTYLQFERNCSDSMSEWFLSYSEKNIGYLFFKNFRNSENTMEIQQEMRKYDYLVNVDWRIKNQRLMLNCFQNGKLGVIQKPEVVRDNFGNGKLEYRSFYPQLWKKKESDSEEMISNTMD